MHSMVDVIADQGPLNASFLLETSLGTAIAGDLGKALKGDAG